MNLDSKKQELYTWKTGDAFVFQPDLQLHNGFNNNPRERTTLLIDFFKESEYTKEKFEKYITQKGMGRWSMGTLRFVAKLNIVSKPCFQKVCCASSRHRHTANPMS